MIGGDRRAQLPLLVPLADPPTLLEWQREASAIHVAPALLDYVQALLAATRGNVGSGADAGARRGLSPRAGLLLLAAARAAALLAGRPMALPEDVQAVFPSVAGHRLAGARARARCTARRCCAPSRCPDRPNSRGSARVVDDRHRNLAERLRRRARVVAHALPAAAVPHAPADRDAGGPAAQPHLHSPDAARPRVPRDLSR